MKIHTVFLAISLSVTQLAAENLYSPESSMAHHSIKVSMDSPIVLEYALFLIHRVANVTLASSINTSSSTNTQLPKDTSLVDFYKFLLKEFKLVETKTSHGVFLAPKSLDLSKLGYETHADTHRALKSMTIREVEFRFASPDMVIQYLAGHTEDSITFKFSPDIKHDQLHIDLTLKNASLLHIVRAICVTENLKYKIEENTVIFTSEEKV